MSCPTKVNLLCITYQDEDGETHNFKLIENVCDRWFSAGFRLSLSKKTLDKYKEKAEDDIKYCEYVFFKWIKIGVHPEYPVTWAGLHTLLIDIGRRTAAEKLSTILKHFETKKDGTIY